MNPTKIPWCDRTWNPVTGCTKGCPYCYARKVAERFAVGMPRWKARGGAVEAVEGDVFPAGFTPTVYRHRFPEPLQEAKPQRIFACSMGDLFDPAFPPAIVAEIWVGMMLARQHTFMVLTKRPERIADIFTNEAFTDTVAEGLVTCDQAFALQFAEGEEPPANIWIGISAETRTEFDERWLHLREMPAPVHYLSWEPALGELGDLEQAFAEGLGWVIAGAQTPGPPLHEREIPTRCPSGVTYRGFFGPGAALRDVAQQCTEAGVPLFYKHQGATPELDGVVYADFPRLEAVG